MSVFLQANAWFPRPSALEIAEGTSAETRAWAPVDIVAAINTWAASAPGVMTNPMTTAGDIIYGTNTATPSTPGRLGSGGSGGAGSILTVNASGIPVWVPQGEAALSIAAGACTVDMAAGATFTGTLTGATSFDVTNTWGNRSFMLVLLNSGAVTEPTWPGGTTLIGTTAWDGTDTAVNYVFFRWRSTGVLTVSYGQEP